MKLNRKWLLAIALVLSLTMAISGTLAYLTDRDTVENVFTMGNVDIEVEEEFDQNSPLYPGVEVDKEAGIKNTHSTEPAYVWMVVSVPNDLAQYIELGWAGSYSATTVTSPHEGYTGYLVKYPTALTAGSSTGNILESVKLASNVDYQNGQYVAVSGGQTTPIGDLSNVTIMVDGFAIQTEGFDGVDAAYAAYTTQWGGLTGGESGTGSEGGEEPKYGDDDSVTYTIPEGTEYTTVSTSEELKTALNNKASVILLKNGEYNWSGTGHNGTAQTVSLYGESKDVVLYHTNEGEGNTDYDFDGYNVNFYGLTISGEKNGASYPGWARMSATYNDCVIKQTYGLYAGSHTFNYCTLNVTGDQYNIWTWGAENATFNNCTFNSDGKAVLLYGTANTKLTINNCLFNDNGGLADKKAAVEIGNDYNKSYELIVNNTKVNGYEINDKGISTGTTLWGNKNSMGTDKLNVVVDGVDVY